MSSKPGKLSGSFHQLGGHSRPKILIPPLKQGKTTKEWAFFFFKKKLNHWSKHNLVEWSCFWSQPSTALKWVRKKEKERGNTGEQIAVTWITLSSLNGCLKKKLVVGSRLYSKTQAAGNDVWRADQVWRCMLMYLNGCKMMLRECLRVHATRNASRVLEERSPCRRDPSSIFLNACVPTTMTLPFAWQIYCAWQVIEALEQGLTHFW